MKISNTYIYVVCLLSLIMVSCEEESVFNTLKVTDIELIDANDKNRISLCKGEVYDIRIKMLPVASTDKQEYSFRFASSDENIFKVDDTGTITGISIGEATLTVQATNNKNIIKDYTISVLPNYVTSIVIPNSYKDYKLLTGKQLDLGSVIEILPETADNRNVAYTSSNTTVATVDENGIITALSKGETEISIRSTDGGDAVSTCIILIGDELTGDFPRMTWAVTASHQYVPDKTRDPNITTGEPEAILDDNRDDTFLSLRKPGKGAETPSDETLHFTIDMKEAYSFNYFRWHHRGSNTTSGLRISKVDLYGSNDGQEFIEIQKNIEIANTDAAKGYTVNLANDYEYRYVKFVMTAWHGTSGSAVQISEVYIGKTIVTNN